MKTYIYEIYENLTNIIDEKIKKKINDSKAVLIQLFSGEDAATITTTLQNLKKKFPHAFIITASTVCR